MILNNELKEENVSAVSKYGENTKDTNIKSTTADPVTSGTMLMLYSVIYLAAEADTTNVNPVG